MEVKLHPRSQSEWETFPEVGGQVCKLTSEWQSVQGNHSYHMMFKEWSERGPHRRSWRVSPWDVAAKEPSALSALQGSIHPRTTTNLGLGLKEVWEVRWDQACSKKATWDPSIFFTSSFFSGVHTVLSETECSRLEVGSLHFQCWIRFLDHNQH